MSAFLSFLTLFSGPIGQLITSALTAGGAAATTWMVSKGMPADSAAVITGGAVSALGALIHTFTGLQTVQIASVNTAANGVRVIPAAAAPGTPTASGPLS